MEQINWTEDEKIIAEAILHGRKVQEYLWQELSLSHSEYDSRMWVKVFQKRVDKISELKPDNPSNKVELRKRILQQAALSVLALKILDGHAE